MKPIWKNLIAGLKTIPKGVKMYYTEADYLVEVLQGKHRYYEFNSDGKPAVERTKTYDQARAHKYFISKLHAAIDPKFLAINKGPL